MKKAVILAAMLLPGCFTQIIQYDQDTEAAFRSAVHEGDPLARHAAFCYRQAVVQEPITWSALGVAVTSLAFAVPVGHSYADSRDDKSSVRFADPWAIAGGISLCSLTVWVSGMSYGAAYVVKGNNAKRKWCEAYIRAREKKSR